MGLTNHFDFHFLSLLTTFFEQVARSNRIINQPPPEKIPAEIKIPLFKRTVFKYNGLIL